MSNLSPLLNPFFIVFSGDCIVIHGSVVHKSGRNTTKVPRTIYTYHIVEKGTKWSEKNW